MSFDQDDSRGGYGGNMGIRMQSNTVNPPRGYQGSEDPNFTNKCQNIESNLYKLNANIVSLTKMVDAFGTPRDNHEFREQFQSLKTSTVNSFRSVENNIKALGGNASGKNRIQQDQLTKRFQGMLNQFKSLCEAAVQKEKKSIAVQRERASSFRQPEEDDDDQNERANMLEDHRRREEQQRQLQSQLRFNQDMIVEREEGMKEIESTMVEINEIFRDLGMAIHEQGAMLDNIESNMVSADSHVEKGTSQLGQASEYQKKARSKMLCLLVIVAIVAAILVIVLVTQLRK